MRSTDLGQIGDLVAEIESDFGSGPPDFEFVGSQHAILAPAERATHRAHGDRGGQLGPSQTPAFQVESGALRLGPCRGDDLHVVAAGGAVGRVASYSEIGHLRVKLSTRRQRQPELSVGIAGRICQPRFYDLHPMLLVEVDGRIIAVLCQRPRLGSKHCHGFRH